MEPGPWPPPEALPLRGGERREFSPGVPRQDPALFTDEDVLACQKQYLHEVLERIAAEPQVFALEIYKAGDTSAPG